MSQYRGYRDAWERLGWDEMKRIPQEMLIPDEEAILRAAAEDGVFKIDDPEPGTCILSGFQDVCLHGDLIQEDDIIRRTETGEWEHIRCAEQGTPNGK